MSINRTSLFSEVFNHFLEINKEVEAIIVSDEEGFIIAAEKRKDIDIEIVSFLTAVVNPVLDRMRNEFSFRQFGTATFDTDEHRLLFVSLNVNTTLSLVLESMASTDKVSPYAYFLAEKCAQIITLQEGDVIQLSFPNFEYEAELSKKGRLKDQIYHDGLEKGGAYRFKFIIIGDHEVGKTSIVRRFVEKKFSADYRATIGLNILTHNFEAFGNKVSLFLWDIGAQQYFKRYRKTYYDGAQAVFIVFDLTKRETFDNVTKWYNELMEFIDNKDLPIIIIGNKSDLKEDRIVNSEEGVKLASDLSDLSTFTSSSDLSDFSDLSDLSDDEKGSKISYIETSALSGDHIEDAFSLIAYHYMIKSKEIEEERLKDAIFDEIQTILDYSNTLTLAFITDDPLWSPGLQILTEIKKLGKFSAIKEKKKEKCFEYPNGLILKGFIYDSYKVSDAEGIFCIFDARKVEHIDKKWKDITSKIVDKLKKNSVLLIGIRVSEKINWSQIMEEFDISEQAEKKMVTVLFFRISEEYRLEIYEQLSLMLNTIKNLLFSY